jgi:hypothetical protein
MNFKNVEIYLKKDFQKKYKVKDVKTFLWLFYLTSKLLYIKRL